MAYFIKDFSKFQHFKAADAMAALLPHIHTHNMKREQQKGILRELIAGLKTGAK